MVDGGGIGGERGGRCEYGAGRRIVGSVSTRSSCHRHGCPYTTVVGLVGLGHTSLPIDVLVGAGADVVGALGAEGVRNGDRSGVAGSECRDGASLSAGEDVVCVCGAEGSSATRSRGDFDDI